MRVWRTAGGVRRMALWALVQGWGIILRAVRRYRRVLDVAVTMKRMGERLARLESGREVGRATVMVCPSSNSLDRKGALKTWVPSMTLLFPNFCLKDQFLWPSRAPKMINSYSNSFYQCFLRHTFLLLPIFRHKRCPNTVFSCEAIGKLAASSPQTMSPILETKGKLLAVSLEADR